MDTNTPTKTISDKVTSRREDAGLTPKEVASAAGMTLPTYRECEAGRRDFNLEQLNRIATALGVNLEYWFAEIKPDASAGIILTPAEVTERLSLRNESGKSQTLANWRVDGKGPKWFRVGRLVRYYESDLNAWIKAQSDSTTSVAA